MNVSPLGDSPTQFSPGNGAPDRAPKPATRWWLTLDAVVVIVFVVVGRDTHQESQTALDVIETAAPFLWGLLAGWAVTRAWQHPIQWRTGIGVVVVTVSVGMVLRRWVYDDGIALPFIIVTTLFLAATMLGWRGIVYLVRGRRSPHAGLGDEIATPAGPDPQGD